MNQLIPDSLAVLIRGRTGLRKPLRDSQQVDVLVRSRMDALGLSSFAEYERRLKTGDLNSNTEVRLLTIGLTNGETHFFRDSGQFALLERTLLPSLIQQRESLKTLRVWSAGCSTGEEAYSIAIVVHSLLRDRGDWGDWRVDILGTDINEAALESARNGVYSNWSFRVVSPTRKATCFEQLSDQWKLKSGLREAVRFAKLDLINDDFPSINTGVHDMDLVFCRNAFIYFDATTVGLVVDKMTRALRTGGYLLTAHGELHGQELRHVQTLSFPESIVYQRFQETMTGKPPLRETPSLDVGRRETEEKESLDMGLCALPPAAPDRSEATAGIAEFERLARHSANEGKHDVAEDWCRRVLAEDPFAARIYYLLAKIAEERKELETAKEFLRKVLYLDPDFVSAYIDLAALYTGENDVKRAQKHRWAALDCLRRLKPDAEDGIDAATIADWQASLEALAGGETRA